MENTITRQIRICLVIDAMLLNIREAYIVIPTSSCAMSVIDLCAS